MEYENIQTPRPQRGERNELRLNLAERNRNNIQVGDRVRVKKVTTATVEVEAHQAKADGINNVTLVGGFEGAEAQVTYVVEKIVAAPAAPIPAAPAPDDDDEDEDDDDDDEDPY